MNDISRRDSLKHLASTFLAAGLAGRPLSGRPPPPADTYTTCFGDLHNHGNVGYAQGSLERMFEIARNHLDFFAFTPHAHWHDIEEYDNNIEWKWLHGFAVTEARWPEVLRTHRRFDDPGTFVTIPGYEWHSTNVGDYHVLFPDLDAELYVPDELRALQQFVKRRGAIMVPHHPANRLGHRGANPALWDPDASPVLEIYSEWGLAEHDRAPHPYIRHTEGGRWTKNTLQWFLAQGHRVGVVASTDDHLGYPGAHGEGLAAVLATELTRDAIFEALRARRTYALTGDRIELRFSINGRIMGSELPHTPERTIDVEVAGWDQVDRVELLKNNRVIHRDFPVDRVPDAGSWREPVLLRFEYGWGPWPVLGMGRTADWNIEISLDGGVIEEVHPVFQSGPLEEDKRDRIVSRTDRSVKIQSFTALRQQFLDRSQKGVVLKARGDANTRVTVRLSSPSDDSLTLPFSALAESNEMLFTGPFPRESAMLHRLVFHDRYATDFRVEDTGSGAGADWYYVRVVQANGQLAWSSPIWVGGT